MSPVADAVARFALAIDDHDWDTVTRCLGGTYRIRLRRVDDRWRITGLALHTRWQTGDGELLARAAARAGARATP